MPMPFSPAGAQLGLNNLPGLGSMLADQSAESADELRKRRLAELQQRQLLGPGGSAAASSLFGPVVGGIDF